MKLDMFDLQSCVVEHLWSIIVLLFISRRLQTQLEAFKTAEAASGKQTKVFVVLFSLFEIFFFISEGNLKREIWVWSAVSKLTCLKN